MATAVQEREQERTVLRPEPHITSCQADVGAPDAECGELTALLDQLDGALSALITGTGNEELCRIGDDQLIGFLQRFERIRNRMGVVDQEIVHGCEATDLPHRLSLRTVGNLLVQTVRIHPGQAHARVRASHGLRGGRSMTGQALAPKWSRLAAAVTAGQVPPGLADETLRSLARTERLPWTGPEDLDRAELTLTDAATTFPPEEFGAIAQRLQDHIDPDGALGDDQYHQATRSVTIAHTRDGSLRMTGRFTPAVGAQISAVLDPLTKPQDGPDGPDLRTQEQRNHDAVADVFARMLRTDETPGTGGLPATVVVTIDRDKLQSDTGYGRLPDGTPIAPRTLLKLACEAEIVPVVLGAFGEVLELGRSRRIASRSQTLALVARDKGCSFPSCNRPATWCERHHIIAWQDGDTTDLTNLTLLCRYHHHYFQVQGWCCTMIDGLPWWIPPRWIDHDQKPLINHRIRPPAAHPRR